MPSSDYPDGYLVYCVGMIGASVWTCMDWIPVLIGTCAFRPDIWGRKRESMFIIGGIQVSCPFFDRDKADLSRLALCSESGIDGWRRADDQSSARDPQSARNYPNIPTHNHLTSSLPSLSLFIQPFFKPAQLCSASDCPNQVSVKIWASCCDSMDSVSWRKSQLLDSYKVGLQYLSQSPSLIGWMNLGRTIRIEDLNTTEIDRMQMNLPSRNNVEFIICLLRCHFPILVACNLAKAVARSIVGCELLRWSTRKIIPYHLGGIYCLALCAQLLRQNSFPFTRHHLSERHNNVTDNPYLRFLADYSSSSSGLVNFLLWIYKTSREWNWVSPTRIGMSGIWDSCQCI